MLKSNKNIRPSRSVRSEIRYFDDELNPVSRDKATWAVFRDVDEKGNLLFEAQGFID
jgi:hypothetical protein